MLFLLGVVLECLTRMRRGELDHLAPFLSAAALAPPGAPVDVAGVPITEAGPLARCFPFMDAAARRTLPGHLLRRARILSALTLGANAQLRVALTGCTGEELVLRWQLNRTTATAAAAAADGSYSCIAAAAAAADGSSSDSGSSGTDTGAAPWRVVSVTRDADDDADRLPSVPHPRASPELVVLAQLSALRQHDVIGAVGFNMLGRRASSSGWDGHLAAFRALLSAPAFAPLCRHTAPPALLGAALPNQRSLLQEVVLGGIGGASPAEAASAARFLWRLGMQADGCWMVRSIEQL
jgi:hypothetical protein